MLILVDSDGKRLRNSVKRFTEGYSNENIVSKASQDIIYEMVDNITRSHSIRKMINKYFGADVLVIQNCEDFKKRKATLEEFLMFLKEMEAQGVKIILTIEKTPDLCSVVGD